jgi:diguanylate cyclase (GGDEF)-like protein
MEPTTISRLELLDAVTKALVDPVFVLDYDGRYLDALGGSERGAYDSLEYLVGKTLHDLLPRELADKFLADVRRVIDSGQPLVYEYELAAEDLEGNLRDGPRGRQWFQGRIAPIAADASGVPSCVAWVVINITRRKELEAELERLATTDELTGLLNRRAFLARVDATLAAADDSRTHHAVALALLDLDHFKAVNDRYGHAVGDAVLQHVSRCLQEAFDGCAALGRIGGEEFAVLLSGRGQDEAISWLESAQRLLEQKPFTLGQHVIPMGFSAGVVVAGHEDRQPGDLLHRADHWLYEAKGAGRHRVAFPGWIDRRQR